MKQYSNTELSDWFTEKARTAAGMRRNILENQDRSRDGTVIGRMYFFAYDAKWKSVLPVWDKYPLVFPIERYSDGFLGLNIHYLTKPQRTRIIGLLSEYASNERLTARTRLQISYDILSGARNLNSLSRPCIKRYLFEHVRSKFIEIQPNEWDRAAQLPIELFVYKK